MRNKYKITILLVLLFAVTAAHAQTPKTNIVAELKRRESVLLVQLAKEKDPEKRGELITKFRQLQAMYYEPQVRLNMVKIANPNYPKTKEVTTESILDDIAKDQTTAGTQPRDLALAAILSTSKDWDSYPDASKIKFCAQLKNNCMKDKKLDICRFAVAKCREYLKPMDYDDLIKMFANSR